MRLQIGIFDRFYIFMSLEQQTADARALIIRKGSISYNYNLVLTPQAYFGLAELTFYIDNTDFTQLPIDFSGTVKKITVNSIQNPAVTITRNFLIFPRKYLQKGRNYISVSYANDYNNDRIGCNTFTDQNEKQYVYTHFSPYGANRVFPCFDQPNLKALMKLSLVTPTKWVASSNAPVLAEQKMERKSFAKILGFKNPLTHKHMETLISQVRQDTKITIFDQTQMLPTYALGFAAGQFIIHSASNSTLPMRIFVAESSDEAVSTYVDLIMEITQKAMSFFESFFQQQFVFKKYDQIWVRDSMFTSMQNAAMVTIDESILTPLVPLGQNELFELSVVVTRSLCNHWFGNLVTMQWWDDIWLKEGFASICSILALQKINDQLSTPFDAAAIYFRYYKTKGYNEDQRVHSLQPIISQVPNTEQALNISNGIKQNKGAAVLKQLISLTGESYFSIVCSIYLDIFMWDNATFDDFFTILENFFYTSFVTMEDWTSSWLLTQSCNKIEVIWDQSSTSTTSTLTLKQGILNQSDFQVLRAHRIQIAFFDEGGNITVSPKIQLKQDQETTDVTYDASNKVAAVLVNYKDYCFIQNIIDPASLDFFKTNLKNISDDATRGLVWFNLLSNVRQGVIRVDELLTVIEVYLLDQSNNFIFDKILEGLGNYADYCTQDVKTEIVNTIYEVLKKQLGYTNDADRNKIMTKHLINYAQGDANILEVYDLLISQSIPKQYKSTLLKKVYTCSDDALSLSKKQEFLDKYLANDSSTLAQETQIVCNTMIAIPAEVDSIYQKLESKGIDLKTRQLLVEGIQMHYKYDSVVGVFAEKYYQDLVDPNVYENLSFLEYKIFYNGLRPLNSNYQGQINEIQDVITKLTPIEKLAAHCQNMIKISDDLYLTNQNAIFNADSNLTQTQLRAQQRRKYIKRESISYTCHITYTGLTDMSYQGLTQITFQLAYLPKLLPVDFVSYQITGIVVNGYNLPLVTNGEFLLVPKIFLIVGVNKMQVRYKNIYNNDGLGCMAYIDKTVATPQEYTYTKFQPAGAHRYFPCFDQPDLKAKAKFNIIIPSNWNAVGNNTITFTGPYDQADYLAKAPPSDNQSLLIEYLNGKDGDFYVFAETPLLPTYLYCIIAGEYYSISAEPGQLYREIPMTIYSLDSYRPNLQRNADFIFLSTTLSLQLYEQKFGVEYQFSKYDSVFCHQFKSGAMQNVGVITFNDSYLYGQTVSVDKMAAFAVVIAHQCSHNWFGNYVTMQWWNDLWLNQSFADFISYWCIDKVRDQIPELATLPSGWLGGLVRAIGGYRQDQMSTTHPVRSDVPNTGVASVIFDSITYRKGSMTLKQLKFLMGQDNFFKGLQEYFLLYGYKNATINDFLTCMSHNFYNEDFTLDDWKKRWIERSSLNVITVEWDIESRSTNSLLKIFQKNFTEQYSLYRYHSVNVAFFTEDGNYTTKQVLIKNQDLTQVRYDASKGIVAILVNEDHQGFLKYKFDKASKAFFIENINLIQNPLTRMIIYFYMNEQVRDGIQKVLFYTNEILNVIGDEVQDSVFDFVLKFLNESTASYIPISERSPVRANLFNFVLNALTSLGKLQSEDRGKVQSEDRVIQKKTHQQLATNKKIPSFQKHRIKGKGYKSVPILGDKQNRIIILQDLLPVFCANDTQTDILKLWLQNNYQPLSNYTISPSQGWAVVKLIFASKKYTLDVKNAAYSAQQIKYPGITADLVSKTCLNLVADSVGMETSYNLFKAMNESLTVKGSIAEGWNNLVHRVLLQDVYKSQFFADLKPMSTQLVSNHFQFFYTNLKPIDDSLQSTIDSFKQINLIGSAFIGHMKSINKIIDTYQLRLMLYEVNSLMKQ